jgi:hypothetical protein
MPAWVRERVDRNAVRNCERLERLRQLHQTLASALKPIEFVTLKGIAQASLSDAPVEDRVQYDIDLYAPRESALAARDILLGTGYESLAALEDFPTDHLPALIRKTGWEWRGDFFDPEIPTAIELHFRFWNQETERLPAPGVEEFWMRRVKWRGAGLDSLTLHPVDALGYTALHVLRHLLRGNVNAFSVYELALMLDRLAQDESFWRRWEKWHSEELRRLEAVSFQLARCWFGCKIAPAAKEAIERLPRGAALWFGRFATSPLESHTRPNKDELWLHLSLLKSAADRWSVARRRLLPVKMPGPVDAVYVPANRMSWRRRWLKRLRYCVFVGLRAWHHALAVPRTVGTGALWWLRTQH